MTWTKTAKEKPDKPIVSPEYGDGKEDAQKAFQWWRENMQEGWELWLEVVSDSAAKYVLAPPSMGKQMVEQAIGGVVLEWDEGMPEDEASAYLQELIEVE